MKNFCFLLIVLFEQIPINTQIIENPKLLVNSSNPFVLSTTDDYYYVITKGKNLKIDKESGDIYNISENSFTSQNYIYISDNSNNNYIYYSNIYYKIINNPFISYERIKEDLESLNIVFENRLRFRNLPETLPAGEILIIENGMTNVGSIAKDSESIIYGYNNNFLKFSSLSKECTATLKIEKINDKLSCKLIYDDYYICAMIINSKLNKP